MEPITIATLVVQALLKYGPTVATEVKALLTKEDPTDADFQKLFSLAQEPWEEMAPKAKDIETHK